VKEHFVRFLLGIMYMVIVVVLLLEHIQMIVGQTQRIMATVEALLLVLPAIVAMGLYIHMKDKIVDSASEMEFIKNRKSIDVSSFEYTFAQFVAYHKKSALSEREFEVAWLLFRGYTNRQIAEELFITESTVKKHVSHIYEKMQVSGRKEFKENIKTVMKAMSSNKET
jgi:DNA-binding NarL/FixJ family response regulator